MALEVLVAEEVLVFVCETPKVNVRVEVIVRVDDVVVVEVPVKQELNIRALLWGGIWE